MSALTRNRPARDLAAVVLAVILVIAAVRACISNDDDGPSGGDPALTTEQGEDR